MDNEELLDKVRDIETAAGYAAKKWVPTWAKVAIAGVLIVTMLVTAVAGYYYFQHDHAVIMNQAQIKSKEELAKQLNLTQGQAKLLASELAKVQDKPPDIRYIVQAPTIEQAAGKVQHDIDAGKSPANQIPADKTVVTPNVKDQKVDVYRITLDMAKWGINWLVLAGGDLPAEFGVGPAYHNKNYSIAAGATNQKRYYANGTWYW